MIADDHPVVDCGLEPRWAAEPGDLFRWARFRPDGGIVYAKVLTGQEMLELWLAAPQVGPELLDEGVRSAPGAKTESM